jgi:hypothetical protein
MVTAAVIIALSAVSVACLVAALRAWHEPSQDPAPPRRSEVQGNLILLGVSLLSVVVLLGAAHAGVGEENRMLWVGLGLGLTLMTVTRPWWFWENYKARWLRELIGDGATTAFYLLVAAAMVWFGLFTDWTFGRH